MNEEIIKKTTNVIAMTVRNAFEDWHADSDKRCILKQKDMKEFNTKIRDAIYTALTLMSSDNERAKMLLSWTNMMIPDYWEEPKMLEDTQEAMRIDT